VLTIVIFFILVNGVFALLIRSLPLKLFDEKLAIYQVETLEKRLYRCLKVNRWKKYLPQAGWMTGFSRRRLPKEIDLAYVKRFVWEICCAMFGHFFMAFLGLLAPLLAYLPWMEGTNLMLWILAVIHFFFQFLYVMIQRYNLPRFIKLKGRLVKSSQHA